MVSVQYVCAFWITPIGLLAKKPAMVTDILRGYPQLAAKYLVK